MLDVSGNNANYWTAPVIRPTPSITASTPRWSASSRTPPGPYGTFDQGGNVDEWNEALPFQDIGYPTYRGVRGGSFEGYGYDLPASARGGADPMYESEHIGFRVVAIPEPASMALLALGGLAMLLRRQGLERVTAS